ncbi:MAG TPA: TIGR03435 family protein [Candidatus Acidoferrales bacterium]|nr:TIGR03435 family protein [Candidatus Acidoferrales bacterium]
MFRTTGAAVILCGSIALGQQLNTKLIFEVASIKPAAPQRMARLQGSVDGGPGTSDPSRIRFTDMPLKVLVMRAYGVQGFQVSGPSWMDNQRFDIIAKVPDGATKEDARIMLQNLLADRFKLKLHKGSNEAAFYELVGAKGGVKLKEAAQTPAAPAEGAGGPPPGPPRGKDGLLRTPHGQLGIQATANGRMRMQGDAVTMARLTEVLGMVVGRPVVDKTGLTGTYDVMLDFSPQGMGPGPKGPEPGEVGGNAAEAPRDSNESGPTIFIALQEHLGLKLESRRGPVDLLVVDSVEKAPTTN